MKKMIMCSIVAALVLASFGHTALAQDATTEPEEQKISDNSFLIEEAYNQEDGVVQHINAFMRSKGGYWLYTYYKSRRLRSSRRIKVFMNFAAS